MFAQSSSGTEILCNSLLSLGLDTIFGLPGTQNILMFEGFRKSDLRVVLAMSETSAGFMANGYFRASGKPAAIAVIPGPGVTYALTGIAEARHDSAAMLCLVQLGDKKSTRKFSLQEMDLKTLCSPLAKDFIEINGADQIAGKISEAYHFAVSGEPGPVVVTITTDALRGRSRNFSVPEKPVIKTAGNSLVENTAQLLMDSDHPIIFAGQGAFSAVDQIRALIERENISVVTTCSGRGLIDEDQVCNLSFEYGLNGIEHLNRLIEECDCVLAVGCKFSHNGSAGFKLQIPREKLIHVDSSAETHDSGNYPASISVEADSQDFIKRLLEILPEISPDRKNNRTAFNSRWKTEIEKIRAIPVLHQPKITGWPDENIAGFFRAINQMASPRHIFVTDSGFHQTITRRYLRIHNPRQLIVPTDFQSIGYGIPAAIGAKAACPDKNVIALVGDGSFAIMAMEMAGAMRENLPLGVIIFNDGNLGSIRLQQINAFGWESRVGLRNPDFKKFAESLGIDYYNFSGNSENTLKAFFNHPGVRILELELKDSDDLAGVQKNRRIKESISNSVIGQAAKKIVSALKGKSGK